jgi:chromosome segregation ATPase
LNKSNQGYNEKLVEIETHAKLGDSEVVPLRYQVQRLTSEVDSISTHAQWLESELKAKNDQLASLRATHASDLAHLRNDLDAAVTEKESLNGQTINLRRQVEQVQHKMERLSKELRDSRQESSDTTLSMEQEMVASQRLVSLQKEQMERLQQRHDSMAGQMEALQKLAKEAEQEGTKELQYRERELEERTKKILVDQSQDYQRQLVELKEQVSEANRRCKQAEDGLLLTSIPARGTPRRKPLAIKDKDEEGDDEPLNLTEIYGRLAEAQDDLHSETLRRKKGEIRVSRIEAEIEASAPLLIRQRQEYELAMERQEEYKNRFEGSLAESQAARAETRDLQVEMGRIQKRNRELDEDAAEMAKQVQTLLVSRSSSLGSEESSGVPASVVEMQSTNQRLLREHRRLTAIVSEMEVKLNADTLGQKVESYETELVILREDRKRQHVMVESIVQQRDLYRTLLNKQDGNLLGSPSEETSALQIVKQQSKRTQELEEQKNQIESDLAKARAELSTVARDKEAGSERLARYESLNAELTGTVDRFQLQVSSSKADVARSEADAAFHREKSERLEETLQRSKDEVARVSASKSGLGRINADLQTAISKANAEARKFEGELQQVKQNHCFKSEQMIHHATFH